MVGDEENRNMFGISARPPEIARYECLSTALIGNESQIGLDRGIVYTLPCSIPRHEALMLLYKAHASLTVPALPSPPLGFH